MSVTEQDFLETFEAFTAETPERPSSAERRISREIIEDTKSYRNRIDQLAEAAYGALSAHPIPDYKDFLYEKRFSGDPTRALEQIAVDLAEEIEKFDNLCIIGSKSINGTYTDDLEFSTYTGETARTIHQLSELYDQWTDAVGTSPSIEKTLNEIDD